MTNLASQAAHVVKVHPKTLLLAIVGAALLLLVWRYGNRLADRAEGLISMGVQKASTAATAVTTQNGPFGYGE